MSASGDRAVWITRAQPGAARTAERVRALGFEAVVAPLLEVRPLGEGRIDLGEAGAPSGVSALAFTSANGVTAFAARSAERGLPVFAVGEATAAAARAAGFTAIASADGDVEALAALVARAPPTGCILHPGAAEPAGDLIGALRRAGVAARGLALYETVAAHEGEALRAAFTHSYAVLIHSAKAARILAGRLAMRPARGLHAVALSAAAAAPLLGLPLAGVEAAALPTEDALLELLARRIAP